MKLPLAVWQEDSEHRATMREIRALERHQRARAWRWWWAENRRGVLVVSFIALGVASVALGILLKVA